MRRDGGEENRRLFAWRERAAVDDGVAAAAAGVERHEVRRERARHAGQRFDAAHDVLDALRLLIVGCVALSRHEEASGQERFGVEAGARALQVQEAAHEQRRADEQDQRHRHFDDDEAVAQPRAFAALARSAGAVAQRFLQIQAAGLQRRRESEHEAGQRGDHDRVGDDARADLPVDVVRHLAGRHGVIEQPDAEVRDRETERRRCETEHHAFDQQLLDQPAAAGAERRADAELALPSRGARQHQVGDVRARDHQHDRHRAHHRQQHEPDVVGNEFVRERCCARAPSVVGRGILPGQRGAHRFQVLARLRDVDARLQAAEREEIARGPFVAWWRAVRAGPRSSAPREN